MVVRYCKISGRVLPLASLLILVVCIANVPGETTLQERSRITQVPSASTAPTTRFALIGDMGTGQKGQFELADQMTKSRQAFPFEFVLTVGDNLYGGESPRDYANKFERPYKALLDA